METVNQEVATNEQPEKVFTQADVDRIVSERLKRDRETRADYEALKEKAAKLDQLEEAQKTELQKATDRADALEKELKEIKKAGEVRNMREKVASDTGVPATLLTGDTEEACREQAENIKAYAKPGYPQVKDAGEVQNMKGHTTRDAFAAWLNDRT